MLFGSYPLSSSISGLQGASHVPELHLLRRAGVSEICRVTIRSQRFRTLDDGSGFRAVFTFEVCGSWDWEGRDRHCRPFRSRRGRYVPSVLLWCIPFVPGASLQAEMEVVCVLELKGFRLSNHVEHSSVKWRDRQWFLLCVHRHNIRDFIFVHSYASPCFLSYCSMKLYKRAPWEGAAGDQRLSKRPTAFSWSCLEKSQKPHTKTPRQARELAGHSSIPASEQCLPRKRSPMF